MIHAVKVTSNSATFKCSACKFRGTLEEGIGHVVSNQFVVVTPAPKKK